MINFICQFFTVEKKALRIAKKIEKAVAQKDIDKINRYFCKALTLLSNQSHDLLSYFIYHYITKAEPEYIKRHLSSDIIGEIISRLESNNHIDAAIALCEHINLTSEQVRLLAIIGDANKILALIGSKGFIDKNIFSKALYFWEKNNGDIRKSPIICNAINNIAKHSHESLPLLPEIKEIIQDYEGAAQLYIEKDMFKDAALCYEKCNKYEEACKCYEIVSDNEGISRTSAQLGNLEKALNFTKNPERKIDLLIRMDKFKEALDYAISYESTKKYIDKIKIKAKQRVDEKVHVKSFLEAYELSVIADCDDNRKDEILIYGRKHLDILIASASSKEEIKDIYKDRLKLEEMSGHFIEAGTIAEEILNNLQLASFLYEKANLFNKAIQTATTYYEGTQNKENAMLRLAELQENGGNLIKAANLYESSGQYIKASELYEKTQHYKKAIECYLKADNTSRDTLIRLYTLAGDFEEIIKAYLQSEKYDDLQKALEAAQRYNLNYYVNIIIRKIDGLQSGSQEELLKYFKIAQEEIVNTYSKTMGVDFGTTNSVAAIFNKTSKEVEIIPSSRGEDFVPSFFGFDENGSPVYGETAKTRCLLSPSSAISHVKRYLGRTKVHLVDGKKYKSEEIAAQLLHHLRINAQNCILTKIERRFRDYLSKNNIRFPERQIKNFLASNNKDILISKVILSVPAYFNDNQKKAIRDSAEIAGLEVVRLIHEPTAAALAYGYQHKYSGTLAVIDLGGGTLDISILDVGDGLYEVITIGGDIKLGGYDIDNELVNSIIDNLRMHNGLTVTKETHPEEFARLYDACENMKINLSYLSEYTIKLPYFLNIPSYMYSLTRTELESIAFPILEKIKQAITKTLKQKTISIDHYLLVGNATKMPVIQQLIGEIVSAKHLTGIDPGVVVATGAALQGACLAGDISGTLLLDVVPYSLGISILKKGTQNNESEMSFLISKDATIPIKKSDTYTTTNDNQKQVRIAVYQGESNIPEKNYFLGEFVLDGILPVKAGIPQIKVTFEINADCVLNVTAIDTVAQREQSIRIEGAVVLNSKEKEHLKKYFCDREALYGHEKDFRTVKDDIESLKSSCLEAINISDSMLKRYTKLFIEKIETNFRLYRVDGTQTKVIQKMYLGKDAIANDIPKYRDRFSTLFHNIENINRTSLKLEDNDIVLGIRNKIEQLKKLKDELEKTKIKIETNIINVLSEWINTLRSLPPNLDSMNPFEVAQYHISTGKYTEGKDILEDLIKENFSNEVFGLLLKSYVQLGLRDEYRSVYKKYSGLFSFKQPDFNSLNFYLKTIDNSIFMIRFCYDGQSCSGTGFAISKNVIVTNRHVIENATVDSIKVIGKSQTYNAKGIKKDPQNDIAYIRIDEDLAPLRIGEFNFVEPGEKVLAVGFPSPDSDLHSENIYVSNGIVNSIRNTDISSEKVIFIDAKIGRGMSGGPLINDLGETIGIITLIKYDYAESTKGIVTLENQPIALPIHLVTDYIET